MIKWLANLLFSRNNTAQADETASARLLELEKETQSLRMSLAARDESIDHLKQENERLRGGQQRLLEQTVSARIETIFSDLAGPSSQILTQADLLENQGKPVQARDVLSVARRMVRALERNGMQFEGQIGQQENFDPNRHTPMNAGVTPQVGQPVTVRFAGVKLNDKILYKAVVE